MLSIDISCLRFAITHHSIYSVIGIVAIWVVASFRMKHEEKLWALKSFYTIVTTVI